ncbi:MAG: YdeI/OmpD-associated family protein [Gemmatimonadetes bacterium]|nr:YdeI/OmpD-associated family protein [Gemmatimonadota bacterium]
MPDFVREMLVEEDLMQAYQNRPPYQQNDYLGWINRAKRADTQARRVGQMLEELRDGDRYMKMEWKPGR